MKRLYIHCGLHKTGSTAIQRAVPAFARRLRRKGTLAIYRGQRFQQHRLAVAIRGARTFEREADAAERVSRALAAHRGVAAVISSESFECVLRRPDALARLHDLAAAGGAAPVLVLYLRGQADYAMSLYLQMIGLRGFWRPFDDVLDEVLRDGRLIDGRRDFQFDYADLARHLRASGFEVVLRSFHTLVRGST
ncbi:MAG: hypothetical protein AAFW69_05340, partial [Pseudomonadota bacterium]